MMADHPIIKKQKVEVGSTIIYKEEVLFNSDTLSKIISYLPSIDLLNLALTSKRFGISDDEKLSVIKKSAHIAVQDIGTEEQLAALPHYDGESKLADYHYLQLLRAPLTFDQLVGAEYVNSGDKSCVTNSGRADVFDWETAFSNNILRAGKHYVSIQPHSIASEQYVPVLVGVIRPGKANQYAGRTPLYPDFYQNFSRRLGHGEHEINNNSIQCCLYFASNGKCLSSDWDVSNEYKPGIIWDGSETMTSDDELGLLLDLDEGTLSVYKNDRKLGVMKRGLAGPYCWVVSMVGREFQFAIKRGTIPTN